MILHFPKTGANHFGQKQFILVRFEFDFCGLFFLKFGPDQNELDPSKMIWMVRNQFGPIEGQALIEIFWRIPTKIWIL